MFLPEQTEQSTYTPVGAEIEFLRDQDCDYIFERKRIFES